MHFVGVVLYNYELMHGHELHKICLVHYLRPSNRKAQEEARMVTIPCCCTFYKTITVTQVAYFFARSVTIRHFRI